MSIKFIHFSDSHLGYSDLDITDAAGVNIREEDVYNSFRTVIDIIIERKPDFVVHAGDIFHRSSPTNKALIIAAQELSRLAQSGIPFYMAAGNHDFPKSTFTTPIHDLYSSVINGKVFYSEEYEIHEDENFIIHALPHINNESLFKEEALKISASNKEKINILIAHLSLPSYKMDEFGERVLPEEALEGLNQFDYVALGHWHKFNHIKKYGNVFYSGSTERFSFSEIGYDKGIIEVTIDKKETRTEFIKIPTRNFYHFKVDNCSQKSKSQIVNEIVEEAKKENIAESIIHLSLNNLSSVQFYEITKEDLNEIFDTALHFTYSKNSDGNSEEILFESESFDLKEQLNNELSKMFTDKDELKQVREITNEILIQIEDEEFDADN